jgi:hypothetical protein
MSGRRTRRNLWPVLWVGLSELGFAAALELSSSALALIASLAMLEAFLAVERYPRLRD